MLFCILLGLAFSTLALAGARRVVVAEQQWNEIGAGVRSPNTPSSARSQSRAPLTAAAIHCVHCSREGVAVVSGSAR